MHSISITTTTEITIKVTEITTKEWIKEWIKDKETMSNKLKWLLLKIWKMKFNNKHKELVKISINKKNILKN